MKDTLAAQGIASAVLEVDPTETGQGLMVNNWSFPATGNADNAIDWTKYEYPGGAHSGGRSLEADDRALRVIMLSQRALTLMVLT